MPQPPKNRTKNRTLSVRVSEELAARVESSRALHGQSLTTYVIRALEAALAPEKRRAARR
jgi:predicted HicB family RNase H-like nuclease